jgi:hypothetical protein
MNLTLDLICPAQYRVQRPPLVRSTALGGRPGADVYLKREKP